MEIYSARWRVNLSLSRGEILEGALFAEPMRVETISPEGPGRWTLGPVGLYTERYPRVSVTDNGISNLKNQTAAPLYKEEKNEAFQNEF